MWRSKASTTAETESEDPRRRFIGISRQGKDKQDGRSSTIASISKETVETRNDADALRSPEEQALQRKKKKWLMLKKALTSDEDGDNTMLDPDGSSKSVSASTIATNLFHEQRQTKVVFHQFSTVPKDVMRLEREDNIPTPETATDVVIRVQVRVLVLQAQKCAST